MIFKTFNNDIDKISAKWGIFDKPFNDIGNAISSKISDINKSFQATDDLIGSIENSGDSIWARLYPNKESIQSQIIDVDALYPDLHNGNFSSILDKLVKTNDQVNSGSITWQKYFSTLSDGEKWQIEFVQKTDLQKASLDDVKKGYENARQSAIAHNQALKQQTLGAKATNVAMSALATAGNMLLVMAITKGVEWLITYNQRLEESRQEMIEVGKEAAQLTKDLDGLVEQYRKLGEDGGLDNSDREQAYNIQQQINELLGDEVDYINLANGKYEEQIKLLQRLQYEKANETYADKKDAKDAAEESLKNKAIKYGQGAIGAGYWETSEEMNAIENLLKNNGMEGFLGILESSDGSKEYNAHFKIDFTSMDSILESYDKMKDLKTILAKSYADETKSGGKLEDFYNNLTKAINDMSDAVQKYKNAMSDYNINEAVIQFNETKFGGIKGAFIDSEKAMGKWINAMIKSKDISDGLQTEIITLAKTWYPQYIEQINNAVNTEATKIIQSELVDKSLSGNIENLKAQASALGITEIAMIELVLAEIRFNKNNLNVSQKVSALKELATWSGVAQSKIDSIFSANSKSKMSEKEIWAEQNGVTINYNADKDGTHTYTYNGKTYSGVNAVNEALADEAIQSQIDKMNEIKTSGSDGDDIDKETKESFNWIETALSRIQRTISNLGKTVSATYKSWGERNSALAQQMSNVSHEIDLQNQAYTNYMTLANNVGLDPYYQRLVQTGNINSGNMEVDSATAEKIKKYQEYYEAALAAEDARIDLESEQMNLIQTNFDSIAKQYDDQLSLIEHEVNSLNSSIDMIEKEGHVVTEDLYTSLIQNADKQMSLLQNKAIELRSAMSGVATGTEMWYSLNSQLLSIEEEMDSLNSSTLEWNNSIRDLEWENFDRILEKMAAVNSEADFLMELLADEDMYGEAGSITDAGRATMGLHATNYNSKMAQANEISKELRALDSDYANDSENLTYLERRNELEQQYRDLILDAKDDEQSLIDMQKEQYDALLDHMSEVIDNRKDMLSKAKDAYDYEKNIAEQTEEVAKLEKQLSAYQGDTSEESRATIQQLKVSLADARENLEETQYEKYISDQEAVLDSLYDETEEWINARLDDEALLLEGILSAINDNAGLIRDTLTSTAYGAGTTLSGGISEYLAPSSIVSQTVEPNVQYAELMAQLQTTAAQLQFNLPSLPSYDVALPSNSSVNNVTINGLSLEFPNVQTPDEWVTYLQHDKRFENIILEITDGNNSLSKYKW